jgi:hypothetical protein
MFIGGLGGAVGALAVLVTLIYLSAQIRQNTRAIKAANHQGQTDGRCGYLTAVFADPVLNRLLSKVWNQESSLDLSPGEEDRLSPLLHCAFTQFGNAYRSHLEGLIDAAWWEENAAGVDGWLKSPHVQRWWTEEGVAFPSNFGGYIQDRVSALAGNA